MVEDLKTMVDRSPISVAEVIGALDTAVVRVASMSTVADTGQVDSVAVIDSTELATLPEAVTEALLLVGIADADLLQWLRSLGEPAAAGRRPAMVLVKSDPPQLDEAAAASGVAVVVIDPRARWDRVLTTVQASLDRHHDDELGTALTAGVDVDLIGLVGLIAHGTGGLVSIEDATSARVLAYSPSKGEADDLRVETILGRAGPPAYLDLLRRWGVFDAIRRGNEVVDVPEHPEQGMRRRLVVGIHSRAGRHLGSIWVQEGLGPLASDAVDVLRGAAAIAARILTRELQAPTAESQLVQRVFGAHGGVDATSAGAYLAWPVDEPIAVIGVVPVGGDEAAHADAMTSVGGSLRLHASAFAPSALTSVMDGRAYLLLPAAGADAITRWVGGLVRRFDGDPALGGAVLRAAIVMPLAGLAEAPAGRAEVDRVLSATPPDVEQTRVTTLAESRTAVLLGEILQTLAGRADLIDPRVELIARYDAEHATELVPTMSAYLAVAGRVRDAAAAMGIHANTLRYRIDRAQQLSGLRLDDPDDRLLTAITLAVRERRAAHRSGRVDMQ